VLRGVWANYRDESFVRQFLSPNLIRKFRLFALSNTASESSVRVEAIHDAEGYRRVQLHHLVRANRRGFPDEKNARNSGRSARRIVVSEPNSVSDRRDVTARGGPQVARGKPREGPRSEPQVARLIYNDARWTAKATISPKPSMATRSLVIFEIPGGGRLGAAEIGTTT
jgi:hypothetical protein